MDPKRLENLGTFHGFDFLRFKPKLFSYYIRGHQRLGVKSFIRMTIALLFEGYAAYYMRKDGDIVGCAVITPGGGGRMKCSTKDDIVIGPYWIEPKYRGNLYSEVLVHTVLHELGLAYKNAYMFINKSNTPSIRTAQHEGFVNIGEAGVEKHTHRWILLEGGGDYIFKTDFSTGAFASRARGVH